MVFPGEGDVGGIGWSGEGTRKKPCDFGQGIREDTSKRHIRDKDQVTKMVILWTFGMGFKDSLRCI